MKRNLNYNIILMTLILLLSACRRDQASHDTYTCPMHPSVLRGQPGTCPVCHMELVKKVAGAEIEMDPEFIAATQSPNEYVLSTVETIRGDYAQRRIAITRPGVITYDNRTIATVAARIPGRLEQVKVRYPYQAIRKGAAVATLYSPELVTAQRDLLYLRKSDAGNASLMTSAKQRLINLGMTAHQIEKVMTSGEPMLNVPLISPAGGMVVPPSGVSRETGTNPRDDGMQGQTNASSPAADNDSKRPELLREGMYVTAGQPLFAIVSTSDVLIEITLPAAEARYVRRGDTLRVSAVEPDRATGSASLHMNSTENQAMETTIDFIEPYVSGGQYVRARAYLHNNNVFKFGQLVSVTLRLPAQEGLWVPSGAVHDMGIRRIVFVKHNGYFSPVEVTTGPSADSTVMIVKGIASGDEIAADARFLVDNEGFIHAASK